MEMQAWALRRMISVYNSVTRRPHVPRELALRRILRSQGFDVPLEMPRPGPAQGSSRECLEEDWGVEEGEEEEEEFLDDEVVEDAELTSGVMNILIPISMRGMKENPKEQQHPSVNNLVQDPVITLAHLSTQASGGVAEAGGDLQLVDAEARVT